MKRLVFAAVILAGMAAVLFSIWGRRLEFIAGGALINLGYRLQDPLSDYDFEHHEITPAQAWDEFSSQNRMASSVRAWFPRTARHAVVALIACMDGRLDTNEIAGDTRRYYYVLRLAGSVLSPKEEEMIELAVANGVKLVVFTTHSDCAAEKAAKNPEQRTRFPHLTRAVDERQMRFEEFLARPAIRDRVARGELMVKWVDLDTQTERASPRV